MSTVTCHSKGRRYVPFPDHGTHSVAVEAGTRVTVVLDQLSPRAVHSEYIPQLPPADPELDEGGLGALVLVFRPSRDRRGSRTQEAMVVKETLHSGTWVQQLYDP